MQNAKSLEEYISILKSEFVSSYDRNAHLYEALPNDASTIPEMSLVFGCIICTGVHFYHMMIQILI